MSPQTRRWIVAAVALFVLGIAFLRLHHNRDSQPESIKSNPAVATPSGDFASSPDHDQPRSAPPPTTTSIRSDAAGAAADWLSRAKAGIASRYWSKFGAKNVGLMSLPPAEAWKALTARANAGDLGAAAAAGIIMMNCRAAKTVDSYPHWKLFEKREVRGLPAHWANFVLDVDAQLDRQRLADAKSCKHVGGILDFAMLMLDRFLQRNDPEAQLAEVEEIKNDEDAIAELRYLSAKLGSEVARRDLARRLIRTRNPAHQTEGLHLLESMADKDSYAMFLLSDCLRNGCGHYGGDPELAPVWVSRAAESGDWFPMTWTIGDLEKRSDPVNALAWALYRQDLTFAGCEEIGFQPSTMHLVSAIQDALRLQGSLDDAQQRRAEAITQAVENHWLSKAEAVQHCSS